MEANVPRIKLTHLINSLAMAGAERVLHGLVERIDPARFDVEVITLVPGGPLEPAMEALGVRVRTLDMRHGRASARPIVKLTRWLRERRPDALVTWMYHANLLGAIAGRMSGRPRLIWNIHNSDLPRGSSKWMTRATSAACARLSRRWVDRVVYVSQASRKLHLDHGYSAQRALVIPNGFDTEVFRPDAAARAQVRRELGLPPETPLVGLVSRFHPQKDPRNFVDAAARIHERRPNVCFVLCGDGMTSENQQLSQWIAAARLEGMAHLLGRRNDMPRLQASLDVAVLSSSSEAFPLAIGEAMSSGVPAVVTDVGDAALLVGPTGRVVPPRDGAALAEACCELLALAPAARHRLGEAARARVVEQFHLDRIAEQYFALWSQEAPARRVRRTSVQPTPVKRAA